MLADLNDVKMLAELNNFLFGQVSGAGWCKLCYFTFDFDEEKSFQIFQAFLTISLILNKYPGILDWDWWQNFLIYNVRFPKDFSAINYKIQNFHQTVPYKLFIVKTLDEEEAWLLSICWLEVETASDCAVVSYWEQTRDWGELVTGPHQRGGQRQGTLRVSSCHTATTISVTPAPGPSPVIIRKITIFFSSFACFSFLIKDYESWRFPRKFFIFWPTWFLKSFNLFISLQIHFCKLKLISTGQGWGAKGAKDISSLTSGGFCLKEQGVGVGQPYISFTGELRGIGWIFIPNLAYFRKSGKA